jgi:hypothetical protein
MPSFTNTLYDDSVGSFEQVPEAAERRNVYSGMPANKILLGGVKTQSDFTPPRTNSGKGRVSDYKHLVPTGL